MKQRFFGIMMMVLLVASACATDSLMDGSDVVLPPNIDDWTLVDHSPYLTATKGKPTTVYVGFAQTKAYMEMNAANDFAKVVWKSGDQFRMYGTSSSGDGISYADFSTTTDGERVPFSSAYVAPSAPKHCIYPALPSVSINVDKNSGDYSFGLNLPSAQVAEAGKVKDEYLRSYARPSNNEDFYFRSAIALVRFKMKGSIASSVTSVRLEGASALSGDFVIKPTADGIPAVTLSVNFGGKSYPYVELSGIFAAENYYYFAVIPCTQNSFSLKFSGASGSTTLISTKTITFARGEITDIGEIDLGSAFSDPASPDMSTIKYMSATAGATKPVTIAVIPDGFTSAEMTKYEMLAKSAITTLFNVEPYKSYKEYFNVYIMKVASAESGANITDGNGTITTPRNCYFGSKWGATSYSDMAADDNIIKTFVTGNCPDIISGIHTIEEVPILMIINDTRYGGICHYYSSGFSYSMVPYTYEGGRIYWPYPETEAVSDQYPASGTAATSAERLAEVGKSYGNWMNTMVHEFGGHCFARFADEYWYTTDKGAEAYISEHRLDGAPYYGVPHSLNISATYANPGYDAGSNGSSVKEGWQHLLDKRSTLMSQNSLYGRIGVFQGGDVSTLNRWRSERVSCMIDNRLYFSTFQRELIVKRIMALAGATFDATSFWAKDVIMDPVRDAGSSLTIGMEDVVQPRPMPMTPPPVFHADK